MGPDPPSISIPQGHPPGTGDPSDPDPPRVPDPRSELAAALVPPSRWLTVLAFTMVVVPFAILVVRLLVAPGTHLYLPDDLALIDLHTRRALQWRQQLGVFDHNGWNHPGPTYFYALSLAYRVLGSGAKAMFVGATLINALAAVACVAVVRRRTTPARALWAALWVCLLGIILAAADPSAITYSEGALGGLVSPWNPMVVIFPLLLFVLLCAAALDRSPLSLLGALLVATFLVQTNISTLVLVSVLFVLTAAVAAVTAVVDHRRAVAHRQINGGQVDGGPEGGSRWSRGTLAWAAAGGVAFVLMWLPPVVQQLTNHPGNVTLITRFFNGSHPTPTFTESLASVVAVYGVLVRGPAEVMTSYLGHTPHDVVAASVATVVALAAGVFAVAVGVVQRNRFAGGLGLLSLAGFAAMVLSVSHVVGEVFGYLVVWAVAVPMAGLIGVGMVGPRAAAGAPGRPWFPAAAAARTTACIVGVVVSAVLCVRVVAIPPLARVSDPEVGRLAALVVPSLPAGRPVFVNDAGAGATAGSRLLDVEKFVGLVNQLDRLGYHPKVNKFWTAQFGPGFHADGTEERAVELGTWTPASPASPGYVGRVGDLSVTVIRSTGGRSTDPADVGIPG